MSLPGSSLLWLLQRGVPDLMFAYQLLLIPHIIWQCFLTFEVLRIEKKAFDRCPSYEPWDVGTNSVYSPMVPVCIYYIPAIGIEPMLTTCAASFDEEQKKRAWPSPKVVGWVWNRNCISWRWWLPFFNFLLRLDPIAYNACSPLVRRDGLLCCIVGK